MVYVVNLSGGKDSTAMLLLLLEHDYPIDYILFADTGVEFPEMYEHLDKLERYIYENYGRHIIRVSREHDLIWYIMFYKRKRGSGKGKPYGFPSGGFRWCSGTMKFSVINKFLIDHVPKGEKIYHYIGFTTDEIKRVKKLKKKEQERPKFKYIFPLVEFGFSEKDALTYCYEHGFDWGGLYEKFDRLSCWICPLKNLKNDFALIEYNEEMFLKIIEIEDYLREIGVKNWKYKPNMTAREIYEKYTNMKKNNLDRWLK